MFSFFKKKTQEEEVPKNTFLEVENSVFNTESPAPINQSTVDDASSYDPFIYHEPTYNVGTYKATRKERPTVVIDKNQLGYKEDDYNDNISTVEIVTEEEPIKLVEEFSEIKQIETVPEVEQEEELLIEDSEDVSKNIEPVDTIDGTEHFKLFGSTDGPNNLKEQTSIEEEPVKLIEEVKYTENGYKICPKCGTILKPDAPVCFMCSKNFVLKK